MTSPNATKRQRSPFGIDAWSIRLLLAESIILALLAVGFLHLVLFWAVFEPRDLLGRIMDPGELAAWVAILAGWLAAGIYLTDRLGERWMRTMPFRTTRAAGVVALLTLVGAHVLVLANFLLAAWPLDDGPVIATAGMVTWSLVAVVAPLREVIGSVRPGSANGDGPGGDAEATVRPTLPVRTVRIPPRPAIPPIVLAICRVPLFIECALLGLISVAFVGFSLLFVMLAAAFALAPAGSMIGSWSGFDAEFFGWTAMLCAWLYASLLTGERVGAWSGFSLPGRDSNVTIVISAVGTVVARLLVLALCIRGVLLHPSDADFLALPISVAVFVAGTILSVYAINDIERRPVAQEW